MICGICCKKIDLVDLLKCNGCKVGYHYSCVNITPATFNDGQTQTKRNFKCDSRANVTRRIRVTDDPPVRSLRVGIMDSQRDKQCTPSFDDNGSRQSEVLTATDTSNLVDVMEKVNTMILEKLSALESKILVEIKDTIRVLALENSKLTQKLQEAKKKVCIL
ncbi:unnamed protein product [Arctia plantaginis]|uniref:Uncharacterized protein n=1 Tax=Arctia plantaginis TaxID=874455 RepID=A0A8S1B3P9_ARCPL|nr:unnamed protein product [Arctia plantaginis]